MKNTIYLILFIIGMILTSSTTVSVMTIRPDKPKSIVVDSIHRLDIQNFTYKYFKKGYIIKNVTSPNDSGMCIVVMEKY